MIRKLFPTALAVALSFPVVASGQEQQTTAPTQGTPSQQTNAPVIEATITIEGQQTSAPVNGQETTTPVAKPVPAPSNPELKGREQATTGFTREDGNTIWFRQTTGHFSQPGVISADLNAKGKQAQREANRHKSDFVITANPSLRKVIASLKDRDRAILVLRYDLNDPATFNKNVTALALVARTKGNVKLNGSNGEYMVLKDQPVFVLGEVGDCYEVEIDPTMGLTQAPHYKGRLAKKDVRLAGKGDPITFTVRTISAIGRTSGNVGLKIGDEGREVGLAVADAATTVAYAVADTAVDVATQVGADFKEAGLNIAADATGLAGAVTGGVAKGAEAVAKAARGASDSTKKTSENLRKQAGSVDADAAAAAERRNAERAQRDAKRKEARNDR